MKAKNEPILAVLLEFALEMLERCYNSIAYTGVFHRTNDRGVCYENQ